MSLIISVSSVRNLKKESKLSQRRRQKVEKIKIKGQNLAQLLGYMSKISSTQVLSQTTYGPLSTAKNDQLIAESKCLNKTASKGRRIELSTSLVDNFQEWTMGNLGINWEPLQRLRPKSKK